MCPHVYGKLVPPLWSQGSKPGSQDDSRLCKVISWLLPQGSAWTNFNHLPKSQKDCPQSMSMQTIHSQTFTLSSTQHFPICTFSSCSVKYNKGVPLLAVRRLPWCVHVEVVYVCRSWMVVCIKDHELRCRQQVHTCPHKNIQLDTMCGQDFLEFQIAKWCT